MYQGRSKQSIYIHTFFVHFIRWNSKFLLLFCVFFLCFILRNFAQVKDEIQKSDTLKNVEINATINNKLAQDKYTAGQANQKFDKRYRQFYINENIGQLLSQQSSAFVKSYGVNNMSTLSLRGASAAQSAVLWNGVPIMNPALGVADISMLHSGLFEQVTVQYGSSSALFGSGSVGGALMIGNEQPNFIKKKSLSVALNIGSFQHYAGTLKANISQAKWQLSLSAFGQSALNNFLYYDETEQAKKMENSKLKAIGGIAGLTYNLKKNNDSKFDSHYIGLHIWHQQYYREIPPALFESSSEKKQDDKSLRSLLEWRLSHKKYSVYAKFSFSNEQIDYRDGVTIPLIHSQANQYFQEVGFEKIWNSKHENNLSQSILVFSPLLYSFMRPSDTGNLYHQFRPAIVAAYHLNYYNLQLNAALRQEWVNSVAAPLLPGLSLNVPIFSFMMKQSKKSDAQYVFKSSLMANLQRTYRIPTLNELYSFPGGNSSLKPEQGWNREVGYKIDFNLLEKSSAIEYSFISHELSYFNRDIKDWIIWMGGAIWTPHNLARVYSRGIETRNKLELPLLMLPKNKKNDLHQLKLLLSLNTSYILSTTKASYLPADSSIGRQIPYTPRYIFQGNIGLQWNNILLNYNHAYTGYRFVTTDESQYLLPYQIGNVQLSYSYYFKTYAAKFFAQIQNIGNTKYEVVSARPMPGRYVNIGVQLYFN